jgi:hypothetical protein
MGIFGKLGIPSAFLLAGVVAVVAACGGTELEAPAPNVTSESSGNNSSADATVAKGPLTGEVARADEEYYRSILERRFALISASADKVSASTQKVLHINFAGAMVRQGYGRGESFLVCSEEGLVPASSISTANQEEIIKMVKQFFDAAKVNLTITSTRPASGAEFTVIHVGGTADDIGCSNESGYLGKAPFDPSNSNAADVAFVFDQKGASVHQMAVAIAHQAGLTFGLDALEEVGSIMSKYYSSSISGFGKGTQVSDGQTADHSKQLQTNLSPSATKSRLLSLQSTQSTADSSILTQLPAELARLTGIDIIASLGALLNDFKSGQPMDISKILNQIDATIPGGINNAQNIGGLQGIEDLLSVIILAAEAAAKQNGGTVQSNGFESILKVFLDPSKLKAQDLLSIAGLAAQIGLAAATGGVGPALVAAINIIIGGLQGSTPPANTPNLALAKNPNLPKFDQLLGIESIENFDALLANLEAHASVINSNFRGNARQALLTMLKIGYSQVFQRLQAQGLN